MRSGLSPTIAVPLLWVLTLHLAARGVGSPLWRRLSGGAKGTSAPAVAAAVEIQLVGFIALGLAAFALAAAGLLQPTLLVSVGLLAALAGALDALAAWRRRPRRQPPSAVPGAPDLGLAAPRPPSRAVPAWPRRLAVGLAAVAVALWLAFLPAALSPLLRHDDDAYHLLLPGLYLEQGGLIARPGDVPANMPHAVELVYAWALAIGDFTAPKVLVWSFVGLTLAAVWAAVQRRAGGLAAGVALVALVAGRDLHWHLGPAYVEPVVACYLLAAAAALLRWRPRLAEGPPGVAALLVGMAAASKYTTWPFVAVLGAIAIWRAWRAAGRVPARRWLTWAALAALPVVPWLARQAAVTGNPVFPAFYGQLGGDGWSAIQDLHAGRGLRHAMGVDANRWRRLVSLPVDLTLRAGAYACPKASLALAALALAGLAAAPWRRGVGRVVPLAAAAGVVVWAMAMPQGRYLVAWMPVLALAAGEAIRPWRRGPGRLASVAAAVVAAGVAQLVLAHGPRPDWEPLVDRQRLLALNPARAMNLRLEAVVPAAGKVLGMWENRFFFLSRDFAADSIYQAPSALARLRQLDDAGAYASELRAAGFTHVVMHAGHLRTYLEDRNGAWSVLDVELYPATQLARDRQLTAELIADHLVLLFEDGPFGVFALTSP